LFEQNFSGLLSGILSGNVRMDDDQLYGGARITNLFENSFHDAVMALTVQGIESMDAAIVMRIRTMIMNRQGLNGGLYVPNEAFHTLVKEQVVLTEAPCLTCARDVLNEMQLVQRKATESVRLLASFPKARAALTDKCNEIFNVR
jgi:hypothetical protein